MDLDQSDAPIIERIQSKLLKNESPELRGEIIADTTPVPVFGNFRDSEIVSIALNPSSNEFPANESNRRLLHLSDLDISPQYYHR